MSQTLQTDFVKGFGSTPPGSPPNETDVLLLGRPAPPGSGSDAPSQGFAVVGALIGPIVRPLRFAAATGTGASAGPLLLGVNICNVAVTNGQLILPITPGSVLVVNALGIDQPVIPPVGGFINANAVNNPILVASGGQLELHSVDGNHWYG
jgi:hypothetical protein